MPRLILVRHAKTERTASSDAVRDLTERGRSQSTALGEALDGDVREPAVALVSTAVRAAQTWDLAASVLAAEVTRRLLDSLYTADPDVVLDEVRVLGEDVETAIVVGHNPTIADLVAQLVGNRAGGAYDELRAGGFSPATTAVFDVEPRWSDIDSTTATLVRYVPPLA
ncbi:SixA phosphatase family protein [Solicola gregarius]|uniref:Histidine phosphatase family protein n=1 Tax=Solicola gregarius TaxID=2908642 RepID=A0AA46TGK4_9ACTN|nr:histidine phosphatase family protein [Solicola gregarius]UYM04974.1 histidine phosphatase family protein [Solicola gregarius]